MPENGVRPAWEEVDAIRTFLQGEGVPDGARLMDVPCGIGRRAIGLGEAGYEVVAVDPNEAGIAAAKGRVTPAIARRVTFASARREDLPGIPPDTAFDAILCLDHPLGRGTTADDVAFLRRLRNHLRARGVLILHLMNRDFFASRPRPFAFHAIGSVEQHEFRSFDASTDVLRLEWKFYERVGEDLKYRTESALDLTLLTPRDLAAILAESGWRIESRWGGWRHEPVSADHRKLIVTARPVRDAT